MGLLADRCHERFWREDGPAEGRHQTDLRVIAVSSSYASLSSTSLPGSSRARNDAHRRRGESASHVRSERADKVWHVTMKVRARDRGRYVLLDFLMRYTTRIFGSYICKGWVTCFAQSKDDSVRVMKKKSEQSHRTGQAKITLARIHTAATPFGKTGGLIPCKLSCWYPVHSWNVTFLSCNDVRCHVQEARCIFFPWAVSIKRKEGFLLGTTFELRVVYVEQRLDICRMCTSADTLPSNTAVDLEV